uniref:Arylacetamide deacetylase-like 3/4 n=1 Tax=Tetraselmis sp. GSL018 TaxID=582737 RepID=A0A061SLA8_9CHLO
MADLHATPEIPRWRLCLRVVRVSVAVFIRRVVLRKKKVRSWSLGYETRVQVSRSVREGSLSASDVDILREGSSTERQVVLGKLAKKQRLSNSVPVPLAPGSTAEPIRLKYMVGEWIRPSVIVSQSRIAPADPGETNEFELVPSESEAFRVSGSVKQSSLSQSSHGGSAQQSSVMLYFHGADYITGGINSHRRLMSQLSLASGVPVLGVQYRLMPLHSFDEILEDAVMAYKHITEELRFPAQDVAVAGDSAGAHLALSLVLHLRETTGKVRPYHSPPPVPLGGFSPSLLWRPHGL